MNRRTAIVVTTIFEPAFLPGFLGGLRRHGREGETTFYVIVDRKTPATVAAACATARGDGFDVRCPDLDEQAAFLASLGLPGDFVPWNTDNRRNVGYLMALADGCDVLISIDDDNFAEPDLDFVGGHAVVGSPGAGEVVNSSDGWFNLCDRLTSGTPGTYFPRGFPYAAQRADREVTFSETDSGPTVAMNAGLWTDEPDVDAVCRLGRGPRVSAANERPVLLGPDVWSPVNTQNTGLTREAALTYYYVRMGFPLKGLSIDRFGDILSGYLTQKCAKACGQAVRVGGPVLDHRRTPHNLFKDLYHELAGIVVIEEFLPWLIEEPVSGGTPSEAYADLTERIATATDRFTGFIWDDGGREFLKETAACMRVWHAAVRRWA